MKHPIDVVSLWERAWNSADADAIADLFADDADFVNVVGLWWHDKASIRDAHAFGFAKMFPDSKMSMAEPHVRHIGTDAAVVQCQWHMVGQVSPAGVPVGEREKVSSLSYSNGARGAGSRLPRTIPTSSQGRRPTSTPPRATTARTMADVLRTGQSHMDNEPQPATRPLDPIVGRS